MKIGIIGSHRYSQALGLLFQADGHNVEEFSKEDFNPEYVKERSLDALLMYGSNQSDEDFVVSTRQSVPEPTKIAYIYSSHQPVRDLNAQKIDAISILVDFPEQMKQWLRR